MAETADAALRRKFRQTTARLERFGADEDTAQLVSSIVQHLEQPRAVGVGIGVQQRGQVRVEPHELAALSGCSPWSCAT